LVIGSNIKDADRIRQKAFELYFAPARQRREKEVAITCRDLHRQVGLYNRHPNVCQVLRGKKLQQLANAALVKQEGPKNGSTAVFTYHLL
jgi:hypothetical protein